MVATTCESRDRLRPCPGPPCFCLSPDDSSRKAGENAAECTDRPDRPDPQQTTAGYEVGPEVVLPTVPSQSIATTAAFEVDVPLARAIARAADAGRFDIVMQLALVLEGRHGRR